MLMMIIPEISAFFIFGYLLVWQQEQKNFKCVIIKLKWMERQRNPFDGQKSVYLDNDSAGTQTASDFREVNLTTRKLSVLWLFGV